MPCIKVYGLVLSLVFFGNISFVQAQASLSWEEKGLYFTNYYDEEGKPDNSATLWRVDPINGGFFYILYRHNREIPSPKLYLWIDRKAPNGEWIEYDTRKVFITSPKRWVALKKTFKQAGNYLVRIMDAEKKELHRAEVEVTYKTKLVFCTGISEEGAPLDHRQAFTLPEDTPLSLYLFLKDTTPFGTTSLRVEVYRHDGDAYSELISTQEYGVDLNWTYTFFRQEVKEAGDYKVRILNALGELVEEGYFYAALPEDGGE